jgi:hypothetical protein
MITQGRQKFIEQQHSEMRSKKLGINSQCYCNPYYMKISCIFRPKV